MSTLNQLFMISLLCLWSSASQSDISHTPRMVFAHYMVCCSLEGPDGSVASFEKEIQRAQDSGIDGFALNVGSWNREPYYKSVVSKMFQAADALGTGFKLFFSFDGLGETESLQALSNYHAHPNYLQQNGAAVVSTYGENQIWGDSIRADALYSGFRVFYVPSYFYRNSDKQSVFDPDGIDLYQARKALETNIDGYFLFGAAATPGLLSSRLKVATLAAHLKDKISMVGVTPFYKGFASNSRVFETSGFAGMRQEWEMAISSEVDWIEIVTWNDWSEATYVGPVSLYNDRFSVFTRWGPMLSHDAYLDASRFYIQWFKSKKRPEIKDNNIFFYYRSHLKGILAAVVPWENPPLAGVPAGWEDLKDCIYLHGQLADVITIEVDNGSHVERFRFSPGTFDRCVPAYIGPVAFKASREQEPSSVALTHSITISNYGFFGNYNYISGKIEVPND